MMHRRVIVLFAIFIASEACAQISQKIQRSTNNRYSDDDISNVQYPGAVFSTDGDKDLFDVKEPSAVPLELIQKINNIGNVSEFFEEFVDKEAMDSTDLIQSRFGEEGVERSIGMIAKPAHCIPESTVVPLEPLNPSRDPTIIYFPTCTRVNRCSGCCSSKLISCQPTETEILTFTIYKSQYTGGVKMAPRGKEIVLVDQHVKCKCDCLIKKSDCNAYQIYDASQCRCLCTNYEEQEKCNNRTGTIWDPDNCRCRCRHPISCTSGTYFDEHQCRCLEDLGLTHSNENPIINRRRFILKPIQVPQENNTKYDTET